MKNLLLLLLLLCAVACGDPIKITGNPDDHSSTSGTLGGAKAENQIPQETRDTARADSTKQIQ